MLGEGLVENTNFESCSVEVERSPARMTDFERNPQCLILPKCLLRKVQGVDPIFMGCYCMGHGCKSKAVILLSERVEPSFLFQLFCVDNGQDCNDG